MPDNAFSRWIITCPAVLWYSLTQYYEPLDNNFAFTSHALLYLHMYDFAILFCYLEIVEILQFWPRSITGLHISDIFAFFCIVEKCHTKTT